ncbi:hypothetical protein JNL27_07670 [bacterium]|nr:hypothetical protein [bacterium]
MFRKLHLLDTVFILLSISMISGCYTVVLHQKNITLPSEEQTGSEPENYSHSIDISSQNSCTSCHVNDLDYTEFGASDSPFGASSLWVYYYDSNIPWWISHADNDDESAEENGSELGDTGMRRYYGRRREALNNDNASSSITTDGGGAVIPSFPASIPTFGGTITTTVTSDSAVTQNTDSLQTGQATSKIESQDKKRDFGVRKNTRKK